MKAFLIFSLGFTITISAWAKDGRRFPEVFKAAEAHIELFTKNARASVTGELKRLGDPTVNGDGIPMECSAIINRDGSLAWIHCDVNGVDALKGITHYKVVPFWMRDGEEVTTYGPEYRINAGYKQTYDKLGRVLSCEVHWRLYDESYGYRIYNATTGVKIGEVTFEIPPAPKQITIDGSCG